MTVCRDCSAAVNNGAGGDRCKNGFIQGGYPTGKPNCLKEDGPGEGYWLFPPDQWEALHWASSKSKTGGAMASNSYCQNCGQPTNSGFVCIACHPAPHRTIAVQQQDQQARQIQDMATIIKRLCRQLRKAEPAGDYKRLSDDALDYLRQHDLLGAPMREVDDG